jgi:nitronate monooxygenase
MALDLPIVQAPMAGGPSTPALAAAVGEAGGMGFLAAGYKTADAVRGDLRELRALSDRPFGLNVFAPPAGPAEAEAVESYAQRLREAGLAVGEPRFDDDDFAAKVALAAEEGVAAVSFAFGLPPAGAVDDLEAAGCAVWVTITTVGEARAAVAAGAVALVVQGVEAGGHRGGFDDGAPGQIGLLALLQLVHAETAVPLVATGGIATGGGVAAVLAAGATAAQIGTAYLRTPEAATSDAHRRALAGDAPTGLTRAFTGRLARGIVNDFQVEHSAAAPSAYPEIHHLTSPIRADARRRGDPGEINLWAGQAYPLVTEEPAADLTRRLAREARDALESAGRFLG